eukprot:NODE_5009_length_731_cov_48.340176_g4651_i0.p1 GENE.NODE_5009_length_731_cov_48.340176_g4651_i0~~NODE_5009_length_731_cov_48.340176_g4651_i0.p1  ORF type:complete len:125 (+),score=6.65 NODE_5009_length_731_cov_48.340176_g4651_i0:191-565(+)
MPYDNLPVSSSTTAPPDPMALLAGIYGNSGSSSASTAGLLTVPAFVACRLPPLTVWSDSPLYQEAYPAFPVAPAAAGTAGMWDCGQPEGPWPDLRSMTYYLPGAACTEAPAPTYAADALAEEES